MLCKIRQCTLIARLLHIVLAVFVIGASSSSVMSQTIADVQRNFTPTGTPGRFVGNGLELMVWFDSEKQVCRALWPASALQNGVINVDGQRMSSAEIKRVLDLIAPTGVRGKPIEIWGWGMINGNVGDQKYPYENLTVKLYLSIDPEAFERAILSGRSTIPMYIPKEGESDEVVVNSRMISEEMISASVADVRWKGRKCAE